MAEWSKAMHSSESLPPAKVGCELHYLRMRGFDSHSNHSFCSFLQLCIMSKELHRIHISIILWLVSLLACLLVCSCFPPLIYIFNTSWYSSILRNQDELVRWFLKYLTKSEAFHYFRIQKGAGKQLRVKVARSRAHVFGLGDRSCYVSVSASISVCTLSFRCIVPPPKRFEPYDDLHHLVPSV